MGPDVIKEIIRDQPIARLGRSDEIVVSVLWLCSPGASFVLGVALPVDGGLQLIEAPPSADRFRSARFHHKGRGDCRFQLKRRLKTDEFPSESTI
jgi:hypothetical protein